MDTKIFDSLLEPTFVLNQEKKITYCNEPAALLTDLSARKLVRSGLPFDEIFKFEVPLEGLLNLSSLNDSSPYQEVKFTTESGKDGKVQVTFQPFAVENEQPISWLVFFRDVTLEETLQKKYRKEFEQKEGYIKELEKARAELEDYSKNLEVKVAERTAELSNLNQLMKALLDSLGQGFFIFNQGGDVLEIASKACETTLEKDPRGQKIWNVLGLTEKQVPGFQKWTQTVFAEMLPFEDLAPLGPPRFPHSQGKEIELQYYPMRTANGAMEGIVVVASDITSLVQAQREAEFERAHASMILQLIKNRRQVASFIRESEAMLKELNSEIAKPKPDSELTFRLLHTLKGGAATFSVKEFADHCHTAETLLGEYKSFQNQASKEKLSQQCLELSPLFDKFLKDNEMILGNMQKLAERWIEAPASKFSEFSEVHLGFSSLAKSRMAFQETFLFEPAMSHFTHYNEVMQNVAERQGKEIAPIEFKNPEFKLLPEPYENLLGTLIHAFRNAADHAIETPDVRQERGKPTAGQITVDCQKKDDQLFICIQDDGGGIDPERIRAKLQSMGLSTEGESDEQTIQHIFDSQFSTRDVVTDLSGRGVGMDAIQKAAAALGGKAWVKSVMGKGTDLFVQVPWIDQWSKDQKLKLVG
jgi:two-component system chemotaxis sensor kinase CheA